MLPNYSGPLRLHPAIMALTRSTRIMINEYKCKNECEAKLQYILYFLIFQLLHRGDDIKPFLTETVKHKLLVPEDMDKPEVSHR